MTSTQHAERGTRHAVSVVLFDFEGTLVDFQWRLPEAEIELRDVLAGLRFDLSVFTEDNYASLRTRALKLAPSPAVGAAVERSFAEIYDRYDADALSRWRVQPFALELLSGLRERGLGCALVTNIGGEAIERALPRLGLQGAFGAVVTRNDVAFAKPSGEGIGKALAALGRRPEEALFVGDSLSDLRAAREARVRVALVSGGESSLDELHAHGPDHLLASLRELPELLSTEPA